MCQFECLDEFSRCRLDDGTFCDEKACDCLGGEYNYCNPLFVWQEFGSGSHCQSSDPAFSYNPCFNYTDYLGDVSLDILENYGGQQSQNRRLGDNIGQQASCEFYRSEDNLQNCDDTDFCALEKCIDDMTNSETSQCMYNKDTATDYLTNLNIAYSDVCGYTNEYCHEKIFGDDKYGIIDCEMGCSNCAFETCMKLYEDYTPTCNTDFEIFNDVESYCNDFSTIPTMYFVVGENSNIVKRASKQECYDGCTEKYAENKAVCYLDGDNEYQLIDGFAPLCDYDDNFDNEKIKDCYTDMDDSNDVDNCTSDYCLYYDCMSIPVEELPDAAVCLTNSFGENHYDFETKSDYCKEARFFYKDNGTWPHIDNFQELVYDEECGTTRCENDATLDNGLCVTDVSSFTFVYDEAELWAFLAKDTYCEDVNSYTHKLSDFDSDQLPSNFCEKEFCKDLLKKAGYEEKIVCNIFNLGAYNTIDAFCDEFINESGAMEDATYFSNLSECDPSVCSDCCEGNGPYFSSKENCCIHGCLDENDEGTGICNDDLTFELTDDFCSTACSGNDNTGIDSVSTTCKSGIDLSSSQTDKDRGYAIVNCSEDRDCEQSNCLDKLVPVYYDSSDIDGYICAKWYVSSFTSRSVSGVNGICLFFAGYHNLDFDDITFYQCNTADTHCVPSRGGNYVVEDMDSNDVCPHIYCMDYNDFDTGACSSTFSFTSNLSDYCENTSDYNTDITTSEGCAEAGCTATYGTTRYCLVKATDDDDEDFEISGASILGSTLCSSGSISSCTKDDLSACEIGDYLETFNLDGSALVYTNENYCTYMNCLIREIPIDTDDTLNVCYLKDDDSYDWGLIYNYCDEKELDNSDFQSYHCVANDKPIQCTKDQCDYKHCIEYSTLEVYAFDSVKKILVPVTNDDYCDMYYNDSTNDDDYDKSHILTCTGEDLDTLDSDAFDPCSKSFVLEYLVKAKMSTVTFPVCTVYDSFDDGESDLIADLDTFVSAVSTHEGSNEGYILDNFNLEEPFNPDNFIHASTVDDALENCNIFNCEGDLAEAVFICRLGQTDLENFEYTDDVSGYCSSDPTQAELDCHDVEGEIACKGSCCTDWVDELITPNFEGGFYSTCYTNSDNELVTISTKAALITEACTNEEASTLLTEFGGKAKSADDCTALSCIADFENKCVQDNADEDYYEISDADTYCNGSFNDEEACDDDDASCGITCTKLSCYLNNLYVDNGVNTFCYKGTSETSFSTAFLNYSVDNPLFYTSLDDFCDDTVTVVDTYITLSQHNTENLCTSQDRNYLTANEFTGSCADNNLADDGGPITTDLGCCTKWCMFYNSHDSTTEQLYDSCHLKDEIYVHIDLKTHCELECEDSLDTIHKCFEEDDSQFNDHCTENWCDILNCLVDEFAFTSAFTGIETVGVCYKKDNVFDTVNGFYISYLDYCTKKVVDLATVVVECDAKSDGTCTSSDCAKQECISQYPNPVCASNGNYYTAENYCNVTFCVDDPDTSGNECDGKPVYGAEINANNTNLDCCKAFLKATDGGSDKDVNERPDSSCFYDGEDWTEVGIISATCTALLNKSITDFNEALYKVEEGEMVDDNNGLPWCTESQCKERICLADQDDTFITKCKISGNSVTAYSTAAAYCTEEVRCEDAPEVCTFETVDDTLTTCDLVLCDDFFGVNTGLCDSGTFYSWSSVSESVCTAVKAAGFSGVLCSGGDCTATQCCNDNCEDSIPDTFPGFCEIDENGGFTQITDSVDFCTAVCSGTDFWNVGLDQVGDCSVDLACSTQACSGASECILGSFEKTGDSALLGPQDCCKEDCKDDDTATTIYCDKSTGSVNTLSTQCDTFCKITGDSITYEIDDIYQSDSQYSSCSSGDRRLVIGNDCTAQCTWDSCLYSNEGDYCGIADVALAVSYYTDEEDYCGDTTGFVSCDDCNGTDDENNISCCFQECEEYSTTIRCYESDVGEYSLRPSTSDSGNDYYCYNFCHMHYNNEPSQDSDLDVTRYDTASDVHYLNAICYDDDVEIDCTVDLCDAELVCEFYFKENGPYKNFCPKTTASSNDLQIFLNDINTSFYATPAEFCAALVAVDDYDVGFLKSIGGFNLYSSDDFQFTNNFDSCNNADECISVSCCEAQCADKYEDSYYVSCDQANLLDNVEDYCEVICTTLNQGSHITDCGDRDCEQSDCTPLSCRDALVDVDLHVRSTVCLLDDGNNPTFYATLENFCDSQNSIADAQTALNDEYLCEDQVLKDCGTKERCFYESCIDYPEFDTAEIEFCLIGSSSYLEGKSYDVLNQTEYCTALSQELFVDNEDPTTCQDGDSNIVPCTQKDCCTLYYENLGNDNATICGTDLSEYTPEEFCNELENSPELIEYEVAENGDCCEDQCAANNIDVGDDSNCQIYCCILGKSVADRINCNVQHPVAFFYKDELLVERNECTSVCRYEGDPDAPTEYFPCDFDVSNADCLQIQTDNCVECQLVEESTDKRCVLDLNKDFTAQITEFEYCFLYTCKEEEFISEFDSTDDADCLNKIHTERCQNYFDSDYVCNDSYEVSCPYLIDNGIGIAIGDCKDSQDTSEYDCGNDANCFACVIPKDQSECSDTRCFLEVDDSYCLVCDDTTTCYRYDRSTCAAYCSTLEDVQACIDHNNSSQSNFTDFCSISGELFTSCNDFVVVVDSNINQVYTCDPTRELNCLLNCKLNELAFET